MLDTTPNAIGLQESEYGAMPSDLQDGKIVDPCGQGVAPVKVSQEQESRKEYLTLDTSGLTGSSSSESANLQLFLENRLKQRLEKAGSTLYKMTWKQKTTPLGKSYYQLVASVPRTLGKESGSLLSAPWTTPVAQPANGTPEDFLRRKEESNERNNQKMGIVLSDIQMQAMYVSVPYPTPAARDHKDSDCSDSGVPENGLLGRVVWSVGTGEMLSGCHSETENKGSLNPALSRWLMTLPEEFDKCAIASYRKIKKK